jgi:hypothetical protein
MAVLSEKQFELDGVVFGLHADIAVVDWTPGAPSTRTNDVDNPTGDGVRMGRDFKGSATWNFSLSVDGKDEQDGWEKLARLAEVWDGDWVREEPDRVLPLRFRIAGETRVVYGRPREWTAIPNNLSLMGRIDVEASFVLVDHRVYGDELHSQVIRLVAPLEVDAGFTTPFIPPFTSDAGSAVREDQITIGGAIPTPIIVTFSGEVDNAMVVIGGWSAGLAEPTRPDNPITIDARPWVRSATHTDGGGAKVSARVTRISKMWLPPGKHTVIFTGDDRSGTGTALVSWREAYRTPR